MVNVARDGKVHVRAEKCSNCLLGPDRIVPGARARQLVTDTRAQDGASFVCHKHQTEGEPESICRGWWDAFAMDDWQFRWAVAAGLVQEVGGAQP